MISALFLINQKGEIILHRFYRDDVSLSAANAFRMQVRQLQPSPPSQRLHRAMCAHMCLCCERR